jgi:hypothetical protein
VVGASRPVQNKGMQNRGKKKNVGIKCRCGGKTEDWKNTRKTKKKRLEHRNSITGTRKHPSGHLCPPVILVS